MANTIGSIVDKDVLLSFSTAGTLALIDKRNAWGGAIGIKVFGELAFAALAIASVVEALVRGIIGVVVGVPLKCLAGNEWLFSYAAGGALLAAGNAAICFMALKENFCAEGELDHDAILPCASETFLHGAVTALEKIGLKMS